MSNHVIARRGYVSLKPFVESPSPGTWFARTWLLGTALRSYSLEVISAWSWLLWPGDVPVHELKQVDSTRIQFILSGERFPIDIIGSYDVDRAKSIIANAPRKSMPVDVQLWRAYAHRMGWQTPNAPDSIVDCSVPAIIATVDKTGGGHMLIDGWHRIDQASADGHNFIQAFYLTEEETKDIFDISWKGRP